MCKNQYKEKRMSNYKIPQLPLDIDLESKAIMKKTAVARSALAEMKGAALSISNESILISISMGIIKSIKYGIK